MKVSYRSHLVAVFVSYCVNVSAVVRSLEYHDLHGHVVDDVVCEQEELVLEFLAQAEHAHLLRPQVLSPRT